MIERNFFSDENHSASIFDADFEHKLFISRLVSEIQKRPDHISLTLTGDGVLALAEAIRLSAFEDGISNVIPVKKGLFPDQNDDLITKKDLMEGLNISHTTLWKWEKSGYLVPVKIGKRIYYRRDDVEKLAK